MNTNRTRGGRAKSHRGLAESCRNRLIRIGAPVQASATPIQPTAAATPKSSSNPGFGRSLPKPYPPKLALMKRQRHLQKISAGISLVILSLGFSSLGLLSFCNKPHANLANVPCVDSAYRIAGSAASLLAGTTFVVASCVYWRRYGWPA